jgi:hypothetical protein
VRVTGIEVATVPLAKVKASCPPPGLARDQIDRANCGGAEISSERIVVHCIVLCIIPQSRHGIAVVISHDGRAIRGTAGAGSRRRLHELIKQSAIHRLLLGGIVVIEGASKGVLSTEPDRIKEVRIVRKEAGREPVHCRRIFARIEKRSFFIQGRRIGCKIMIESFVLAVDDHEVFDRGRCLCSILVVG